LDHQEGVDEMTIMRVVMHAHSNWSYDGHHSLAWIAKLYGRLGADVVMMSEHDTGFNPDKFEDYRLECARASTPDCLIVPGIEYSSPDNDIHILTWGMTSFRGEHRPVDLILDDTRAQGGVAILAHPVRRRAWEKVDPGWFELLSGIELWNRKSDGISWGREALELLRQSGLPAYVGHDFHRHRQLWPLYQKFDSSARPKTSESAEILLVKAITRGESIPCAFGQPLDVDLDYPAPKVHLHLEKVRRGISRIMKLFRR
jgi:predicted metal-dependent phosphoesterase TrpH